MFSAATFLVKVAIPKTRTREINGIKMRYFQLMPGLLTLCLLVFSVVQTALAADPVPGEEYCSGPVNRLEFTGNKKTRDVVMLEQLSQMQGAECSLDSIIDGMQSIMDLRLFKRVSASLAKDEDQLVLTYDVVEKIYFVPLPRFSRTSDGELRLGAQLRWDNFYGLNHKVRITSERREEDDGEGRSGELHRLEYRVPRFFGSDHGFELGLKHYRKQTELVRDEIVYGEASRVDSIFKVGLSRWMNQQGVTSGLVYHFGFSLQRRHFDDLQGELGPFTKGRDVVARVGIEKRDVRDDLFRLRGRAYGMNFRLSSTGFASDYSYNRTDFFYRRYKPLSGPRLRNLNYQVRVGYSDGGPFGDRHYSLGGGENLRGYKPRSKTGDILTLVNVEYLQALEAYQTVRWILFADVGNVYRRSEFNPFKQKLGVGAGLRWKLLSFSNTDLRIDTAWDFERSDLRFYFSTNLTF